MPTSYFTEEQAQKLLQECRDTIEPKDRWGFLADRGLIDTNRWNPSMGLTVLGEMFEGNYFLKEDEPSTLCCVLKTHKKGVVVQPEDRQPWLLPLMTEVIPLRVNQRPPDTEARVQPRDPGEPHRGLFVNIALPVSPPRVWGALILGPAVAGDLAILRTRGGRETTFKLVEKVQEVLAEGSPSFHREVWTFEDLQAEQIEVAPAPPEPVPLPLECTTCERPFHEARKEVVLRNNLFDIDYRTKKCGDCYGKEQSELSSQS